MHAVGHVSVLALAALGAVLLACLRRARRRRARVLAAVSQAIGQHDRLLAGPGERGSLLPGDSLAELSVDLKRAGRSRELTIERIADEAAAGARELGDLIEAQRPPVVEEHGLAHGIATLAAWHDDVHGLDGKATVEVDGSPGPELETAAYRAAECLLAAAVRGGMRWAEVTVSGGPAGLTVSVVAGPGPDGGHTDAVTVTLGQAALAGQAPAELATVHQQPAAEPTER
jgi:hypothetical protein